MKEEILDWIDRELEQIDQGIETKPSEMPEALRLALKAMVEGITGH